MSKWNSYRACGFFGDSVIVASQRPPGFPMESKPASAWKYWNPSRRGSQYQLFGMYAGLHLGSFFNVNQPPPTTRCYGITPRRCRLKDDYHFTFPPPTAHSARNPFRPHRRILRKRFQSGTPQYDGLLVNFNKRVYPSPWHGSQLYLVKV